MRWYHTHTTSLAWLAAGLCFALISVHEYLWWLFVPGFFLAITAFVRTHTWQGVFWWSWYLGTAKALGGFALVWHIYPLQWIDMGGGAAQIAFIFIHWLTSSAGMGASLIVVGLALFVVKQRSVRAAVFLFPLLWVAGEVLGSLFVSVVWLGSGGFLNIDTAHGYSGFALSHLSFLYAFADVGGVYLLSALTAVCGLVVYTVLVHRHVVSIAVALGVVAMLWVGGTLFAPSAPAPLGLRVVAVDLRFSSADFNAPGGAALKERIAQEATTHALLRTPDIILLPEDARLTPSYGGASETLARLQSLAGSSTPLVIDTSYTMHEGASIQRAYYYDLARRMVHEVDKQFLVAQGEYPTHLLVSLLHLIGKENLHEQFTDQFSYQPGPLKDYAAFPDAVPGMLFCFDSSSAVGVRRVQRMHQFPLVVHAVSHSWFHEPFMYWQQLDDMLRVQALWNDVVIVQAGNMVRSKAYLPDGTIVTGSVIEETPHWSLVEYTF